MTTLSPSTPPVKPHPVGRPREVTQTKEAQVIQALVKGLLLHGELPPDLELARESDLSERTIRGIRLAHGVNRWEMRRWLNQKDPQTQSSAALTCTTPWAGLWLLAPVILDSALPRAVTLLNLPGQAAHTAWPLVLTLLLLPLMGFTRLLHLHDFRHAAELGLALLTGRTRLWADSTVWDYLHRLSADAVQAFYQTTAAATIDPIDSHSAACVSFDEHVVPIFTKRRPLPLGKTRVPTRGRAYPAVRLYAHFDLLKERFLGLVVTPARKRLSQMLPTLIAEVRSLKQRAGQHDWRRLRAIFDRGGYKGSLFAELVADPDLTFVTLAGGYATNVRQWEAIPKEQFHPYTPPHEKGKVLKLADTVTAVGDCPVPLRSVVIRDDTLGTKQKWRVILTNDRTTPAEELDAEYRPRQKHEMGYRSFKHALKGDYLPKAYRMVRIPNEQNERRHTVATVHDETTLQAVQLVGWLRFLAFNLVRDLGQRLGSTVARMEVATLVRKFLLRPGQLQVIGKEFHVTLEPFEGHATLTAYLEKINQERRSLPWLGNLVLQMHIAPTAPQHNANCRNWQERVFANSPDPSTA